MKSRFVPYNIRPIAEAAEFIYEGQEPWLALGNFLEYWWTSPANVRQELIEEPPPPAPTLEGQRWAAFCAATVEEVCKRTSFLCPDWVNRPEFFLTSPWYYYKALDEN